MMSRKVYLAEELFLTRLLRSCRSSCRILEAELVVISVPMPDASPEMSLYLTYYFWPFRLMMVSSPSRQGTSRLPMKVSWELTSRTGLPCQFCKNAS